jgi:hypothetical protein
MYARLVDLVVFIGSLASTMPAENARLGSESDPHDAIGNKELIELMIGQRHAARARRDWPAAPKN